MDSLPAGAVPLIENALVNIRTSTNWDGSHTGANILLNYENDPSTARDGSEGWVSSVADEYQHVVIGGSDIKTFVALRIQGRGDQDQWVRKFKVRYTVDGIKWENYNNGNALDANRDRHSIVTHVFTRPIVARSVSIDPVLWYGSSIALRMEIYATNFNNYHQYGLTKKVFQTNTIKVDDKSSLNTSTNNKFYTVPVVFEVPFDTIPKVNISISYFNLYVHGYWGSLSVEAKDITRNGFNAVFGTPERQTQIYKCDASYVAYVQYEQN